MAKRKQVQTQANVEIKRHWGDVPVVDARKTLRVFIQPEDVRSARGKDPGSCVFAQACKRQFAASKVLFFKSVAYVELPGPNGKRRVERFKMSRQMRELVEHFDRGRSVPEVAGFELKRFQPSDRLDGKVARNRVQAARRRAALLNGTLEAPRGVQGKGKYEKPPVVVDLEVRDGRGRVQFKREAGDAT